MASDSNFSEWSTTPIQQKVTQSPNILANTTENGIIVAPDAQSLAEAMDINQSNLDSAWIGNSDQVATGVSMVQLGQFPVHGLSFAVLSTGKTANINTPDQSTETSTILGGPKNAQNGDLTQLKLRLHVPADANCAAIDFAFYTEEYPNFFNTLYHDVFTAELGGSNLAIVGSEIVAPLNFAVAPDGGLISSQTMFGLSGNTGTTYGGATPLLTARTPITPGITTEFVFSIQDLGDPIYDSTVFLDNFRWEKRDDCVRHVEANYQLHLPLIASSPNILPETKPDLIGSFAVEPNKQSFEAGEAVKMTAVITNQGNAPAGPFYVDLYINPSTPPNAANATWSKTCSLNPCFGIAWSVPGLAPGQSVILTSTDDSFAKAYTQWPGWFAAGTTDLYLYIDSYNLAAPSGAVNENDEANNRFELHGFTVAGVNPAQMNPVMSSDPENRPKQ